MADILPAMYSTEGRLNREWLLSKLWEVINSLPESAQLQVMARAVELREQHEPSEETKA